MDTFNPNQMPGVGMQNMPEKKSMGPLVAVIIILALIIIGGLYFLKTRSSKTPYVPVVQNENAAIATDSITDSLKAQGTSDSLKSIESDLRATDLNSLNQGAAAIGAQLQ